MKLSADHYSYLFAPAVCIMDGVAYKPNKLFK